MSEGALKAAAFFDMDGTLLDSTIVHFYAHLSTARMNRLRRAWWTARFAPRVPLLALIDLFSRSAFNRFFYRYYRGMEAAALRRLSAEILESFTLPRMFPAARAAFERLQSEGYETVLVTGSVEMIAAPLGERLGASAVIAARLEEGEDGRFTGRLTGPPLSGEAKAEAARAFATERGIDLSVSRAYGDSMADAALLRLVGNPTAVNPSRGLLKLARRENWPVERWTLPKTKTP